MSIEHTCQFLREIRLNRNKIPSFSEYPYSLEAIKELESLEIHPSAAFFIGDNGSGKSTYPCHKPAKPKDTQE